MVFWCGRNCSRLLYTAVIKHLPWQQGIGSSIPGSCNIDFAPPCLSSDCLSEQGTSERWFAQLVTLIFFGYSDLLFNSASGRTWEKTLLVSLKACYRSTGKGRLYSDDKLQDIFVIRDLRLLWWSLRRELRYLIDVEPNNILRFSHIKVHFFLVISRDQLCSFLKTMYRDRVHAKSRLH